MHCNERECFVPLWKTLKLNGVQGAFKHIADYLFSHKDHIIKLGFSNEVPFAIGDSGFVLKGVNAGRKKDKRVESSS
jgi:hypothetical protein